MKKLLLPLFAAIVLSACHDPKQDEKALLNEIITIHDKVMGNDEMLMQNKMKLDTILKEGKFPEGRNPIVERGVLNAFKYKLNVADNVMENWMQKFDPEQKGKTHEQIMAYYADQKREVSLVDSQLNAAVKESTEYLKAYKK